MSQERVLRDLVSLGYENLPEVGGRGEFARRGGIVDGADPAELSQRLGSNQLDLLRAALAGDLPTVLRRNWEDLLDDRA